MQVSIRKRSNVVVEKKGKYKKRQNLELLVGQAGFEKPD